ncbi:MAG: hypothetical protein KGZ67_13025 [Hydrogenophaga sp.]|jgi:hypothetical protein|nr:hypothetical protein [Hydrogenophaga sp.]
MNEDMQRLRESMDRLRCDLSATNQALCAMAAAMPPEQLQDVLTKMAKASAAKQATFEQIPTPTMRAAVKQMLESEDRLYQLLQGASKLFR